MNLQANPITFIPKPVFGQDRASVAGQWAEWRKQVKAVHKCFEFLNGRLKGSDLALCDSAKAVHEAIKFTPPGSEEVVVEAIRRLRLRAAGDGSINKDGMTEWEVFYLEDCAR